MRHSHRYILDKSILQRCDVSLGIWLSLFQDSIVSAFICKSKNVHDE